MLNLPGKVKALYFVWCYWGLNLTFYMTDKHYQLSFPQSAPALLF